MDKEPYSNIPYIDESFRYAYSLVYKKNNAMDDVYFLVGAIAVSDAREDHAILEFIDDQPDVTNFIVGVFVVNVDLLTEDWLAHLSMNVKESDDIFITQPFLTKGKSANHVVARLNEVAIARDYIVKDSRIREFLQI